MVGSRPERSSKPRDPSKLAASIVRTPHGYPPKDRDPVREPDGPYEYPTTPTEEPNSHKRHWPNTESGWLTVRVYPASEDLQARGKARGLYPPPEDRSRTRLTSMVKVTLRTMLATIQNRQPLPAQPLPPPPPPNTMIPASSPGRVCSSLPLVSLMYPRSLLSEQSRVCTRGDRTRKDERELLLAPASSPVRRGDGSSFL